MEEIQIGERQAIALAEAIESDFVLLDDYRARRLAKHRGVNVVGTLGILMSAAEKGLLDLDDSLQKLTETNFRVAPELIKSLLTRNTEANQE